MSRATETVPLFKGEDWAKLEELRIDAEAAKQRHEQAKKGNRRAGDDTATAVKETAAAFDAYVDEAAERAEEVVVSSIGRLAYRNLRLEHPPRTEKRLIDGEETEIPIQEDRLYGVNTETFPDPLLTYVDTDDPSVRTIVKPEFNSKAELRRWLDFELTEGQYNSIWTTAHGLNTQGALDPSALKYGTTTGDSRV